MKKPYQRLMEYAMVNTMSDDRVETSPTTQVQFDLANRLYKELEALGVSDLYLDDSCVLYGKIPATPGQENAPAIGFIAHLDTEPVCSGTNVKPVCAVFNGEDVVTASGKVLSPSEFPVLQKYLGQELVLSEGNTLLGADDKAGVAEIMTAVEYLPSNAPS